MTEAEAEAAAWRGDVWDPETPLTAASALPDAAFWRDWLLSRSLPASERFRWQQALAANRRPLIEPEEFHSGRLPPPPGREAGELAAWKALALARFLHHQNHDAGPATAALRCVWLGRLLDFSWRSPRRALFFDFSDHTLMEFCAAQVASPPPSAAERHRVLQALDAAGAAIGFFAAQGQIRPEHAEIWLRITGHLSSQVQQWKTG